MDNMYSLIDILFVGAGIYFAFVLYKMLHDDELNKSVLLGQDMEDKKFRDRPGYIRYMTPRLLALALVTTLYGIDGLVDEYVIELGIVNTLAMIVFAAVLVWYVLAMRKGRKLYY